MKHAINGYYANNPYIRTNIVDFLIKSGVVTDGTPKTNRVEQLGWVVSMFAGAILLAVISLV